MARKSTTTTTKATKSTTSKAATPEANLDGAANIDGAATIASVSAVRNSPIPKIVAAAAKREIGHGEIAERAYGIHTSGQGGSQDDNWFRAERELRGSL